MLIKEIARQKSVTKSKLTYMDPPMSPRRPEPAEPAESGGHFGASIASWLGWKHGWYVLTDSVDSAAGWVDSAAGSPS